RGRLIGNLSVDIGSWRAAGPAPDPNPVDRDEIPYPGQYQIKHPAATARDHHLDDFIGLAPFTTEVRDHIIAPRRDHAPFPINLVDEWSLRPRGEPWSPNEPEARDRKSGIGTTDGFLWTPDGGGYLVHFNNLVVAGTHMRTFTRMATMEAANESARHA